MTVTTPEWLLQREVGLCPCGCIGKRRTGGFVEKTIGGAANLLRQSLFADDIAVRPGLLQAIEPRIKLVTILSLLVTAAFVHHVVVLLAMCVVTLALAVWSAVPLGFFVKRVWLFIPMFTGIIVAPAALSFVTPGTIVVPLGTWFGHPVGLTGQGLEAAVLIVTRVAASISLVVLLTLTTPWNRLLASLRALAVPRMFLVVLAMTYRYLFHLLNGVTDMYTARRARTVTRDKDAAKGRAFVAATAGATFGKAHALSDEVHLAMVARGYTGRNRSLQAARPRAVDALWFVACVVSVLATIGVDGVLR